MSATSARPRVGWKRPTKWVTIILFLLPALALYLLFVLFPVVQAAHYSLYKWNGLQPLTDFVGLKNYVTALSSDTFITAVSHNLLIIVLSLALQIPFSLFPGSPAEPALPGPGDLPVDLLSAVRPLGSHHRRRLHLAPAARGTRG